jgi:DNA repair protein RadA/Sms
LKKPQRLFICNQCGAEYSRWAGKCETCNSWNTIFEENQSSEKFVASKKLKIENYSKPKSISEIEEEKLIRLSTGFRELDLVVELFKAV